MTIKNGCKKNMWKMEKQIKRMKNKWKSKKT